MHPRSLADPTSDDEEIKALEEEIEEKRRLISGSEAHEDGESAPSPPKRSSATNQRLKRLSKLIKDSLPSSSKGQQKQQPQEEPKPPPAKAKIAEGDRKSLREKIADEAGELAVFLRERRAVSESRFKMLDQLQGESDRNKLDIENPTADAASSGTLTKLKSKFERSQELQSPTLLKDAMNEKRRGSRSSSAKKHKSKDAAEADNSTTSPESGVDDSNRAEKKRSRSTKGEKRSRGADKEKRQKRRKEKGGGSGSGGNQSDREKKGKRLKKEREKERHSSGRQSKKQVSIANGGEAKHVANGGVQRAAGDAAAAAAARGNRFYQTLLLNDDDQHVLAASSRERQSRSATRKGRKRASPARKSTAPSLSSFLKEKKIVSDSVFKRWNGEQGSAAGRARNVPAGVLQGAHFYDNRSVFENGSKPPPPNYPRSLSNLEKRNLENRGEMSHRPSSTSPGRPTSVMSGESGSRCRLSATPRPGSQGSLVDQEEYRNYILEMLHTSQRSPRFQQLQAYYNILDRAMQLERRSDSMEVHKLKSDELIDFDAWKKMRGKEKAKDELSLLLRNLDKAQWEREFHYRPKDVQSVRWKGDIRLRGRDRSVEHLKNLFASLGQAGEQDDQQKRRSIARDGGGSRCSSRGSGGGGSPVKDTYKPLWRPRSVTDIADDINRETLAAETKRPSSARSPSKSNVKSSAPHAKASPAGRPPSSMTPRSRSSLTTAQVTSLRGQLNDILTAQSSVASSRSPSRAAGEVAPTQGFEASATEAKLSRLKNQPEGQKLSVKPIPQAAEKCRREDAAEEKAKRDKERAEREAKEDEIRRINFFKIGKEIRERNSPVLKRYLSPAAGVSREREGKRAQFDLKEAKPPIRFQAEPPRDVSPRTCYSLESERPGGRGCGEAEGGQKAENDYLLVLNSHGDEKKTDEVKSVVDAWASGDESGGSAGGGRSRARGRGKPRPGSSKESLSSSGASTGTVIHKSVEAAQADRKRKLMKSIEKMRERREAGGGAKSAADQQCLGAGGGGSGGVEELRKSFENLKSGSPSPVRACTPVAAAAAGSVRDVRRSFERLAVASPTRSVTFELRDNSLRRVRSSSEETRRSSEKSDGRDGVGGAGKLAKSSSNPDLLSTLVAESRRRVATRRLRHRSSGSAGSGPGGSRDDVRKPPGDPTKYSRAYLAMIKSGEVVAKRNKIEGISGHELPEANRDFISKHLTDISRPVIKTQEIADVGHLRKRLQKAVRGLLPGDGSKTPPGKKMKHVSRSVGHSKILGTMLELQGTAHTELDRGTLKLFERARDEDEYLKVFRSGEVGSKVDRFEGLAAAEQRRPAAAGTSESGGPLSSSVERTDSFSELGEPDPSFSWARKFGEEVPDLPRYNAAQRQLQFANYYGYQPSERATRADTPPGAAGRMARRRPRSSDWLDARRRVFQDVEDHEAIGDDEAKKREDPSQQPMSLPPGT